MIIQATAARDATTALCGALCLAAAVAAGLWPGATALAAPPAISTVDRLCLSTAATPPSSTATAIAAAAVREHDLFGGHIIARDGLLVRFGAVETDAARDEAAGRSLPWRLVMRYWESLGALADGPLQLRQVPKAEEDAAAPGTGDLVPLGPILSRLRGAPLGESERAAAVQAAMRAAASDVPWSAAFISHVALAAGVPRLRFTAAMAHLDYVAEAARRRRDEANGMASGSFYRACDPHRTPMRPGDLLCLHRHAPATLPGGGGFAQLVPALAEGERPVWNLHCDVVISRDVRRRTVTVIGGNVLQSVARRDLRTDRRGALGAPRATACPPEARTGPLCRPEAAPWFVLLQTVDPPEP